MAGDEMRAKANRNTQACIVATAERLVRQMGYQKTMVADIAGILRMSPANIYRFFGSKRAIYEAVAARLMGEVETAAAAIASEDGEVVDRLRRLLAAIHLMNARRYTGDEKLHRMVAMAMKDDWQVYNAHVERMILARRARHPRAAAIAARRALPRPSRVVLANPPGVCTEDAFHRRNLRAGPRRF
jgi:AcrR family transcriptional regulator